MNDSYPTAATAPIQNWYQGQAELLYTLAAVGGLTFPGALAGALLAAALWHATREPLVRQAVFALTGVLATIALNTDVLGWFWQAAVALVSSNSSPPAAPDILRSAGSELLLGPALLLTLSVAREFRLRTPLGHLTHEHRLMTTRRGRSKALTFGFQPGDGQPDVTMAQHPPGAIRLGVNENRRAFDLALTEIDAHVFVPGATRMGKSTTLLRLADGALSNGYGVVIIDCKGVGLSTGAKALAQRYSLPFFLVDPHDPSSLGYDACTGDPAHVANKLVGAFTFARGGEIYQQVALNAVPQIVRGIQAANQQVTLRRIQDALAQGGIARLARDIGVDTEMGARLRDLEGEPRGVASEGRAGLYQRLGALLEGQFGQLFEKQPALDWNKVTEAPSVTYFPLSATAAGQDVELFGRVITQDLKQLCDTRLRALTAKKAITRTLVIYDEFAALNEPRQIVDLLLQASGARMPVVLGTQFVPQEVPIRTPMLQAGTIICHRVAAEDAEAIATEIGTRDTPGVTSQVNFQTGETEMGSIRNTKEFHIHPDVLKELPVGVAAVCARRSDRKELVHVYHDSFS